MLKVRAMGTVEDIEWFERILDKTDDINVTDHSEILTLQGTKNYFRAYFQIEKQVKKTPEDEGKEK